MGKLAVIWILTLFIVYIDAGNGGGMLNGGGITPQPNGGDVTSSPTRPTPAGRVGDGNVTPSPTQPAGDGVTSQPTEGGEPTQRPFRRNRGGKTHMKWRLRSGKRWVRDPGSWDFSSDNSDDVWRSNTVRGGWSSSSWGSDNGWDSDSDEFHPTINNMNKVVSRFGDDSDSDDSDWFSERWDSDSDGRLTIRKSAIKTVAPKRQVGVHNNVLGSDSGWYSDDSNDRSDDWYSSSSEEWDGKIINKIGNNKQNNIDKAIVRPRGHFSDSDSEWYSSEEWDDKRINKIGNNKNNNNIKAGEEARANFSDSDSDWYSSTSEERDDKMNKRNGNNKNNNNIKAEVKKRAHFDGSDSDWFSSDLHSDDRDDRNGWESKNDDNGDDWFSDDNDLWESDSSERNVKWKTANPNKVQGNGKVVIPKTSLSEGWEDDSDMDDWWDDNERSSRIVRRLKHPTLRSRTAKRRLPSRALGLENDDTDDTDEKSIPGLKFLGRDDD